MLKIGQIVELQGRRYEVILANYSRARIRPMFKVEHKGEVKSSGKAFTFISRPADMDISPTANLKIVGDTGRKERAREYCGSFLVPVDINETPTKERTEEPKTKPVKVVSKTHKKRRKKVLSRKKSKKPSVEK